MYKLFQKKAMGGLENGSKGGIDTLTAFSAVRDVRRTFCYVKQFADSLFGKSLIRKVKESKIILVL